MIEPKQSNMKHQAAVISSAFSTILRTWLKPFEFDAINSKNYENALKGSTACATHDYCDPNEAMWTAFENEVGRELDLQSPKDMDLVNEAWTIAKDHNFDAELIEAIAETLV